MNFQPHSLPAFISMQKGQTFFGLSFLLVLKQKEPPSEGAQQPPAMRVGLKLKQRNILSGKMVSVQATKKQKKGCFSWQIV